MQDDPLQRWIDGANISAETKKTYTKTLKRIQSIVVERGLASSSPSYEWIACHPRAVIQAVTATFPNERTVARFVAAGRALFKHVEGLKERKPECFAHWSDSQEMCIKQCRDIDLSAEPTEREARGWMDWPHVLEREKELAATEYGSFDHLLLAMYCLIEPLRQNFGCVALHPDMPDDPHVGNFIVVDVPHKTATLFLNEYKTAKFYKQFSRQLPTELVDIILANLRQYKQIHGHTRKHLFVDCDGKPYTNRNSFTCFSNNTLKRLFGRSTTVTLLRHSYISNINFNEEIPASLDNKAKMMTHSLGTQQIYRVKMPQMTRKPPKRSPSTAGVKIQVIKLKTKA